jgi:hypothetical protein
MVVVSVSIEQYRAISDQLFYHCEVRPRILVVSVGDSNVYGTLAIIPLSGQSSACFYGKEVEYSSLDESRP